MFYIVQIELLDSARQDEERRQRIVENFSDSSTIELRTLPRAGMKIQLANGTHIEIRDVVMCQHKKVIEPDCIALVR